MGVDVVFELQYLLSDALGEDIVVKDYSYSSDGVLCITVEKGDKPKRVCIEVKQCKGIQSVTKRDKCIIRYLSSHDEALARLRDELLRG